MLKNRKQKTASFSKTEPKPTWNKKYLIYYIKSIYLIIKKIL